MVVYGEVTTGKESGKDIYQDSQGTKYQVEAISLMSDFSYKKPVIDESKALTKDEQEVVDFSLKETGRKLIHKEAKPVKNDYKSDFDRGTVEYNSKCRNYSFHKVVIPDGTIIKDTNFTQKEPHTEAIIGKNLTFIGCNLNNVEKDASWVFENSSNLQFKNIKVSEEDLGGNQKKVIISRKIEDKKNEGVYNEVEQYEEVVYSVDDYNLLMLKLNK